MVSKFVGIIELILGVGLRELEIGENVVDLVILGFFGFLGRRSRGVGNGYRD